MAEELDVDLAQIQIEHGPPSPAYYNGRVIEEGYPFPSTDTGAMAEDVGDKSTGRATYAIDIRLPGMRFGAVQRSPDLGGTLRNFDPSAAQAMPNVDAVIFDW